MTDKTTASAENVAKQIIEFGQSKQFDKLQKLLSKCDTKLVGGNISISNQNWIKSYYHFYFSWNVRSQNESIGTMGSFSGIICSSVVIRIQNQ